MSDAPPPPPPPSTDEPEPVAPQAPRNGLGIAALILGIIGVIAVLLPFGLWVAGILGTTGLVLGLVGYGRFQRGHATNGTISLWGIFTGALAVIISIAGAVILVGGNLAEEIANRDTAEEIADGDAAENTPTPATETSASTQPTENAPTGNKVVDVYALEVGDCLATPPPEEGQIISLIAAPCSEPHGAEVFAAVTLPDGDFPGDYAIFERRDELCIAEFEGFVGLPYENSVLAFWSITPSERSWAHGDRVVVCAIYDPTGKGSGSLCGAER